MKLYVFRANCCKNAKPLHGREHRFVANLNHFAAECLSVKLREGILRETVIDKDKKYEHYTDIVSMILVYLSKVSELVSFQNF